jgi:hypothetical protein
MIVLKAFMDGETDVVSSWKSQQCAKVRAAIAARMTYLRQQNREGWTRPHYDGLRDGIGEVRFKVERVNYRALGFFGPGRNEFTFCFFATKTDDFDPRNAIDIAVARKQLVEQDESTYAVKLEIWGQA